MKKVLIALDYNPTAQKIAEEGYALAKSMNAHTTLLHVISDAAYYSSDIYSPLMGFDSFTDFKFVETASAEQLREAALDYLDKLRQRLNDTTIQTIVKEGDFGEQILETATEINADMIVMGTHSRRGLEKILVGSVAEKVLRQSVIPLFIIPTKIFEEK
ncbi:universal stress protein [Agriterribacter sp.]|uniref:universal stress protein n=1 Tax=Agriterribacter sp. TaxID=2821509 RepID=UPI002CBD75CB|nr:universal stress protein [Agriterribacter sp.]HRP56138.1 universal stress protein [Agriterribacter sp.]